jgi:hypothetical protein
MLQILRNPGALALAAALAMSAACSRPSPSGEAAVSTPAPAGPAIAADVERRLAQFVQVDVSADLSALSAEDLAALDGIVAASRVVDEIFRLQQGRHVARLAGELERASGPLVPAAREYFRIMQGPWDRLDGDRPFVGATAKPPGAGFYPEDLTKEEFERWIAAHPGDAEALRSDFTVVRRDGDRLVAVPFAEAYREPLARAAAHLRAAAKKTANASLVRFLETRAAAFESNDYVESDMAWMDFDAPLEPTIGPYETYEDGLFGYKASFEAYAAVALPAESAALARYKERLPWLERNLPIPDEHKNFKRGTESPIRVVDVVFAAGDANSGVKAIAYNLPNLEKVREAKGSKKVMMRNIIRAKYDAMLVPIAGRVLAPADAARVTFDAFFEEVLHHELSHGLGPGTIAVGGRTTEVRTELKELYSTLEEAKADVMGVYNILALVEQGVMSKELRAALDPTYVAGLFRAARFGVHEAHGQGVISQFNYLMEKGALALDADGRYRTVPEKFAGGLKDLLHDMLMLQATGDYEGTRAFLARYGQPSKEMLAAIDRLADLPVDLDTRFPQAAAAR